LTTYSGLPPSPAKVQFATPASTGPSTTYLERMIPSESATFTPAGRTPIALLFEKVPSRRVYWP